MLAKSRFLFAAALLLTVSISTASAAALNQTQIDSIVGLLQSFGADAGTIANVEAALNGTTAPAASTCSFARDLDVGASGADVSCLQESLISRGFTIAAGATGYFGPQTQAALAAYQKVQGISPALGYFGPITRANLSGVASSGNSIGTAVTQGTPSFLAPGTTYTRVRSSDSNDEEEEGDDPAPGDSTAPSISAISDGTPDTFSTTISWTTDEASNARVEYGTTTDYGTIESDGAMATSHSIEVDNLIAGQTYHFRVSSTDASGNAATSSDDTFAVDKFSTGAKVASVGDSIMQFEHSALSTTLQNQADGELTWARFRSPNFRHEVWYDDTNTTANDRMSIYGDTTGVATGNILFSGANLGYAGDTATGILSRTAAVLNTTADIIVYAAGTNIGSTDNSSAVTIAAIEDAVEAYRAEEKGVILATIRPRAVAESPTGLEISPASMERIITINDWIRANAERLGATLWDPWEDLRDPAYDPGDSLYGTVLDGVSRDDVHLAPLGAWLSSETLASALDSMIDSGTWFNDDPTVSNLLAAGAFTGTSGTIGGGMTGTLPTGTSVLVNGSNVTGTSSMEANPETGGNTVVLVATSTGAGTSNTFSTLRFSFPTVTTGFTQSDYVAAFFEIEAESSAVRPAFQVTVGSSTAATYSRGLGQTTSTYNSEPYPTGALNGWIVSEPMSMSGRTNIIVRFDTSIRTDQVGTTTVKIKRAFLRTVENPATLFPWDPI